MIARTCHACGRRVLSTSRRGLPEGWLALGAADRTVAVCGSGDCIAEFFALLRQAMNREESET
jgi:hypothetical protein